MVGGGGGKEGRRRKVLDARAAPSSAPPSARHPPESCSPAMAFVWTFSQTNEDVTLHIPLIKYVAKPAAASSPWRD